MPPALAPRYEAHHKRFVRTAFNKVGAGTLHAHSGIVIQAAQRSLYARFAACESHHSVLALLAVSVALFSACQAPISATKTDPARVYRQVDENAIADGKPSEGTQAVLFRYGLNEQFARDPDPVLKTLQARAVERDERQLVFALSELNYLAGRSVQRSLKPWEPRDQREYYLAAAVYAWFYLFAEPVETAPIPYDRQFRLACDLYNRALAEALMARGKTNAAIELSSGRRRMVQGELDVKFSSQHFPLPIYEFTDFMAADHYRIEGLTVRNRQPGLGAPLVAVAPPSDKIAFSRAMPGTVVLRPEGTLRDLENGGCPALLELYSGYDDESFKVGSRLVPLENDISAPLAYSLNQTSLWKVGERQFLTGVEQIPSGIYEIRPYEPGKIPVVFVHGTFSSPVWWVEMLNTLNADPVLRKRCQFWWFVYNSSSPAVFSALRLREALTEKLQQLDPQGADRALHEMVVVGHSQGGLLTKLTATDTQDKLWSAISTQSLHNLQLSAEQEKLVREYTVFKPLPFLKRVVFICTPHRGSYQAGNFVRNLARRMITLPEKLVQKQERLLDLAARLDTRQQLDRRLRTSLDSMSPRNRALLALAEIPLAPGIKGHSIIAVKGNGDYTQGKDGLVQYSSAHLEGMESEYIVRGSHSCLSQPATIEEVRRILRLHIAETASAP